MSFKKNKIDIISMGCSKNLVDSERLIKRLEAKGYTVEHNPDKPDGEYVVVNTCGFIADAKEESVNILLELGELKKRSAIGRIVAMGCLSERYKDVLPSEMPEVDVWIGKFNWSEFVNSLPDLTEKIHSVPRDWERVLTTPPHSAYLKISEGCNRFCAFCAIPLITGRHKSRPIDEIVEEVTELVSEGVREFNIIAQDLSSYGLDIYGDKKLAELIDRIAAVPGVDWIRLHYAYPADFPYDVLDVMARRPNVCKYIDIALQHISDNVLKNMRRHISGEETSALLAEMRRRVPGIKIRTTMMVGFPGETEADFEELMEFVRTQKFDRLGAFAYSEEEDTWAAQNLEDNVPEDVKQKRLDRLMELQENISEELNRDLIGRRIKLIVDEIDGDIRLCRSEWDSPEVDCLFEIEGSSALPGDMIEAEITEATAFDLRGRQV